MRYFVTLSSSTSVSGGQLQLSVTVSPSDESGTLTMGISIPVDSANPGADIEQAVADGLAANFSIMGVRVSQILIL